MHQGLNSRFPPIEEFVRKYYEGDESNSICPLQSVLCILELTDDISKVDSKVDSRPATAADSTCFDMAANIKGSRYRAFDSTKAFRAYFPPLESSSTSKISNASQMK
jgi:hypothetical protein